MIGAYRGKSLLSRLIQFRTWSPYSHIAEINEITGELVEAWHPGGVRACGNYHEGHTQGTIVELYDVDGITVRQRHLVWAALRGELGKGYDFAGIYGFLVRKDRADQNRWFCSELVFAKYQVAGVDLLARVEPHKVSPGLLVMSPRLKYVGNLVVGEDLDLLGRVPVEEIAKLRASEMPQNGLGGVKTQAGGQKRECRPVQTSCRDIRNPSPPPETPISTPGGQIA